MKPYITFLLLGLFCVSGCHQASKKEAMQPPTPQKMQTSVRISTLGREASCVYMTRDENNSPLMSWVEIDTLVHKKYFYFSRLDTTTGKFGSPVSIPLQQNTSIHEEGMPKIAVKGDGSLFAIFETSDPLKGSKWGLGDIRYIQSFDNGKTWTSPQSVAPKDYAAQLSANFSGLNRLANGQIGISWLGSKPGMKAEGRPVKFAQTLGKDSLSTPIVVDSTACECCRTAVSSTENGHIVVAYRDLLPGQVRDISVVLSKDGGKNFSAPDSFSHDHWVVNGCPHDGPAVVAGHKHYYVAYFTNKEGKAGVNYAALDSSGNLKTRIHVDPDGRFVQLALLPNHRPVLAYNSVYKEGDTFYSKIMVDKVAGDHLLGKEISAPRVDANFPVLQAIDQNRIAVAWSAEGKIMYRIVSLNQMKEINPVSSLANSDVK